MPSEQAHSFCSLETCCRRLRLSLMPLMKTENCTGVDHTTAVWGNADVLADVSLYPILPAFSPGILAELSTFSSPSPAFFFFLILPLSHTLSLLHSLGPSLPPSPSPPAASLPLSLSLSKTNANIQQRWTRVGNFAVTWILLWENGYFP